MAVPSSGEISLAGIWNELEYDNYTANNHGTGEDISLSDCSDGTVETINTNNDSGDRPDRAAPHDMTEFYSYDHDASGGGGGS